MKIQISDRNRTCSICGKIIPKGHRFYKRSMFTGSQHLNCCDYEDKNVAIQVKENLANEGKQYDEIYSIDISIIPNK